MRLLLCIFALLVAPAVVAAQDIQEEEEKALLAAVDKIAPSVVKIETFGGLEKVGKLLVGTGPTTGLIVSEDGYIISSAFNFVQKPSSILVTLPGGDNERLAAQIVARDQARMLVLLKVEAEKKLPVPVPVPRKEMVTGQWTVAVGRTFKSERPSMSVGILSAANRIWGKAVQTDAKVSPANYGGPLIDIQGRVLGVLAPFSPQATNEIAGAEWYDSGIGFASPLEDVFSHLDQMKQGNDLKPGILGIGLKGNDIYALPAEIAAVPGKSPAAEAGFKPGDVVVEVDGQKIVRQAQLKHALGKKYAGDTVNIVVKRGDKTVKADITLVDEIKAFQHSFLGVLPMRGAGEKTGFKVRYVYPDSPAQAAGIQAGDVLTKYEGEKIPDAASMQEMLASHVPGDEVTLTFTRDGKEQTGKATLATLPEEIPGELPPAYATDGKKDDEKKDDEKADDEAGDEKAGDAEGEEVDGAVEGVVEIQIPEVKNKAFAYIPKNYDEDLPHGLIVWLHAPGDTDRDKVISRWRELCDKNRLILLAPQAANPARWTPGEVEFIGQAIDNILGGYNIDRTRVMAHGYQAGAAMAYLTVAAHTDRIRAVAAVDAALPGRVKVPPTDPVNRLAFYTTVAEKSRLAPATMAGVKRLQEMKHPVTVVNQTEARYLKPSEIADLVRWFDTLDRI